MSGSEMPNVNRPGTTLLLTALLHANGKRVRPLAGFTLVELMIAVVIIGILTAIAYPGYTKYMRKARRSDAQTALLNAASRQEKFFTECNWYAGNLAGTKSCATSTTGVLAVPVTSPAGHYTLAIAAGPIDTTTCSAYTCGFTLTASPISTGRQAGDGMLRIDSTGIRQWDRNNDSTFGATENTWKD